MSRASAGGLRAASIGNKNAAKRLPTLALTLGQHFDLVADAGLAYPTDADRRAAWAEHGPAVMDGFYSRPQHPAERPEGWWQYTEAIPARLRRLPDDWRAEEPVKLARARWLARSGLLRDDEIADARADTSEDARPLWQAIQRGLREREAR